MVIVTESRHPNLPDVPWPDCVPTLTDGVVVLRAHRESDAPRIVEQCIDAASMEFLPLPRPMRWPTLRSTSRRIRTGWSQPWGRRAWVVTDAGDSFLGTVNLHDRSPLRAEIGFGLHPDGRGRGLMSRAVRLLAQRAFDEGVAVLRWRAVAGNWASRRVAQACGFGMPVTVAAGALDHAGHPRDEWHATLRAGEPMLPTQPRPPVLETPTLRLRPFGPDDGPSDAVDEPDLQALRFTPAGAVPTRAAFPDWLAEREARYAGGGALWWCLAERHTDRAVGMVALFGMVLLEGRFQGELGYWVYPSQRGRGHVAEALPAVRDLAFASCADGGLGLLRLHATVDAENLPSLAVLTRLGMREWGRSHASWARIDGSLADGVHLELLSSWPLLPLRDARARGATGSAAGQPTGSRRRGKT